MILLGLGSNMGDRLQTLKIAMEEMEKYSIQILRCASFYETPAWGITQQNTFINTVCSIQYQGKPVELLDICQEIEQTFGRKRILTWGPRTLDIDILEFEGIHLQTDRLQIPHPYYLKRAFVMIPLSEMAPDYLPTGQNQTVLELAEQFREELGSIKKLPA